MQNLMSKYKKVKAEMGLSGASPSTWLLFEKMAKIVDGYCSMNVGRVVEESFSYMYFSSKIINSNIIF
ncbi:unnamed protein product [Ceratitis capitata]|uniref:(Mediterranean fruit fly) hypothetical protein n=1 Tax=Ceratitis capitata TaxID=7213 RepID=A0A811U818_CERCA|nr:unnamed protein product [Ceratitis capitata]